MWEYVCGRGVFSSIQHDVGHMGALSPTANHVDFADTNAEKGRHQRDLCTWPNVSN